jgi:hypothetical protein
VSVRSILRRAVWRSTRLTSRAQGRTGSTSAMTGLCGTRPRRSARYGRFRPDDGIRQGYRVSEEPVDPHTVLTSGGRVWFTAPRANIYGYLDQESERIARFKGPYSGSSPYGLAAAPVDLCGSRSGAPATSGAYHPRPMNSHCSNFPKPHVRAGSALPWMVGIALGEVPGVARGSSINRDPCRGGVDPLRNTYSPDARLELVERLEELRGRPPFSPFFLVLLCHKSLAAAPARAYLGGHGDGRYRSCAIRELSRSLEGGGRSCRSSLAA